MKIIQLISLVALNAVLANAVEPADSQRGERLFETESCIQCHRIGGKGGDTGPDLSRRLDRGFTPAGLTAAIWNHAPVMWTAIREKAIRPPDIDEQAAADLFAYFYSVRFFENPGDAARGKQLFTAKHCADCHGITTSNGNGAPPVVTWKSWGDPVALADAMWTHGGKMREAYAARKIAWPELSGQNLTDILVYLRNQPETRSLPARFDTASSLDGKALFASKGCVACHTGSMDLKVRLIGKTLTGIAASMWSHAPKMAKAPISLGPGEMRAIVIYLWNQQLLGTNGNAGRGKKVFSAKNCAACHNDPTSGAPSLAGKKGSVSAVSMVSTLWRHGPAMLEKMQSKGLRWRQFEGEEMPDLIAYLNAGAEK
ncbi:MAG: c-type cytochrome [Bryobacteraceae bacterium]